MAEAAPPASEPGPQPQSMDTAEASGGPNASAEEEKRPTDTGAGPSGEADRPGKKAKKDASVEPQKPKEELTAEDLKGLNARQYLEKTVVPLLMQGMQQLVKERPSDPYTALSDYIRDNNPKTQQPQKPG